MAIAVGSRLAQYEVLQHIGSGGMGEVYRAKDHKLGREVAIKVLPEAFQRDPERIARFKREAQLLASLNHPNIAAIYGLEESSGRNFLVLELVPGETLREQILRGALPVEEALGICKQIAEALEAAHEKGIIHRDLKPANVKVTPEGKVKVLDFGLAKAFAGDAVSSDPSESPTLSLAATQQGVILGTAAYMSPEQARGKKVDKRTDIWALGCVLYELLTGKQAFPGENITETLAAVLKAEPEWQALPATIPPNVRVLLRRCLHKDANKRFRDAADVQIQMEEALAAPATPVPPSAIAPRPRWHWAAAFALASLILVGVFTDVALRTRTPAPEATPITRFAISVQANDALALDYPTLALSPDGNHLAYAANHGGIAQLYLRARDSLEARPIQGTEGAANPFFSPDGQWIGFIASGGLKKVSISGGAPVTVSKVAIFLADRGASWDSGESIVFSPSSNSVIFMVPAAGGEPKPLTILKGEVTHRWPHMLPGGKAVLFTSLPAAGGLADSAQIVVQRLDTGERKTLLQGASDARYVPTGHLVFVRSGTLMAVAFDLNRLDVIGDPSPVIDGVLYNPNFGGAQFSFSNTGSLAYIPGIAQVNMPTLDWVDRKGVAAPLKAPPHNYSFLQISPDGQQLAAQISAPKPDIWIYNFARETLTRLTFEGSNSNPRWTRDGKRVLFASTRGGAPNLYWKPADGSGAEERLTTGDYQQFPGSLTLDGRTLLYSEAHPKTGRDIWLLPLEGERKGSPSDAASLGVPRKPRAFLQTPYNETAARLSPDDRFVAYNSDESGRNEIYLQPYPGPGGKYQISTEGGQEITWSAKSELFYRTNDNKLMAVEIKTQPALSVGKPRMLFQGSHFMSGAAGAMYDVTPDGQRFVMIHPGGQVGSATQINMVLNWFEELKRRVPVK